MPNTSVRAAAEGMPKINRRSALTVTGAGLAAALAGVAASTSMAHAKGVAMMAIPSDPGLRPLIAKWRKVRRMVLAYGKLHTAAENRFYEMRLPRPEKEAASPEEMEAFRKVPVGAAATFKWKDAGSHTAALALWTADCERIHKECGLDAAGAEWEGLLDLEADAAGAVLNYPVRTLDGLAAKLRVHAVFGFEATDFAEAIALDVRRIRKAVRS